MTYTFVAVREDRLWGVTCPSLPGVFGVGKTRKAAERDFAGAARTLVEYLDDIGEALPTPRPVHLGSVRV
jgi:predicted RNase H-like HicB family nuclease